jgi:hypothetical protein
MMMTFLIGVAVSAALESSSWLGAGTEIDINTIRKRVQVTFGRRFLKMDASTIISSMLAGAPELVVPKRVATLC